MKYTVINSGLLSGMASVVLTLLFYILGAEVFAGGWTKFVLFLVSISVTLYIAFQGRKEQGGYWSYGQAFKFLMVMGAIGAIISLVFSYLLMHVIDPGFGEKLAELQIQQTIDMLEGFGTPESAIDKQVTAMEKQMESQKTFMGQLMGFGFVMLFLTVLNAILSLFLKKNKPEFA